jgi:hypothetical protein
MPSPAAGFDAGATITLTGDQQRGAANTVMLIGRASNRRRGRPVVARLVTAADATMPPRE